MLVEKELRKLFRQLLQDDVVHIEVDGSDIIVRVYEGASKLFVSTPVYNGGNFIPKSVRKSLEEKTPFARDHIKTYFTVDENNFQISLNYIGKLDLEQNIMFKDIIEEFSWLAEEWRRYLDEHDKNDLIYVRVNK